MYELWKQIEPRMTAALLWLVELSRAKKLALLLSMDGVLCVISVWISFSLRLGAWDLWNRATAIVIVVAIALWLPIFLARGIYRSIIRYVGSRTMIGIATSCMMMSIGLSTVFVFLTVPGVPRTIAFLQPMVFATLLVTCLLYTSPSPRDRG